MKNTQNTPKTAILRDKANRNFIASVASFGAFFAIPYLPIHVMGMGVLFAFNFGVFMACITTAVEQWEEAEAIEKR